MNKDSSLDKLVYQSTPTVEMGGNKFINVPVILQFDDTPLIEVVKFEEAGFRTEIPIYDSNGTYLAKVKGSRLFPTQEGTKSGLKLKHYDKVTACELNNNVLFEITRLEAASLKTEAELYTPTGHFVKYKTNSSGIIDPNGNSLDIAGIQLSGNVLNGCAIGILMKSNGSLAIGCNRA